MTSRTLTSPIAIRGDVPGLLVRGVPVHWRDEETPYVVTAPPFHDADDAMWAIAAPCAGVPIGVQDDPSNFAIDWSSPIAIYAALHWLSARGHDCWWMRPAEVGGRTADWNEAAILVSVSVGRVVAGGKPVVALFGPWSETKDRGTGAHWSRESEPGVEMLWVMPTLGWRMIRFPVPPPFEGPETGDAGKRAADRAALDDGAALLGDDGAVVVGVADAP